MDRAEIARSLTGAWRLFLGRPDAMRFFDTSVDGFWRSFRAIILVAPLYALTALADRHDILTDANPTDDFGNGRLLGGQGADARPRLGDAADPARRSSPASSASGAATRPMSWRATGRRC